MNAEGWALAVLLVIGGVVVVNHLGVDLGAVVSSSVHGIEHLLGRPIW